MGLNISHQNDDSKAHLGYQYNIIRNETTQTSHRGETDISFDYQRKENSTSDGLASRSDIFPFQCPLFALSMCEKGVLCPDGHHNSYIGTICLIQDYQQFANNSGILSATQLSAVECIICKSTLKNGWCEHLYFCTGFTKDSAKAADDDVNKFVAYQNEVRYHEFVLKILNVQRAMFFVELSKIETKENIHRLLQNARSCITVEYLETGYDVLSGGQMHYLCSLNKFGNAQRFLDDANSKLNDHKNSYRIFLEKIGATHESADTTILNMMMYVNMTIKDKMDQYRSVHKKNYWLMQFTNNHATDYATELAITEAIMHDAHINILKNIPTMKYLENKIIDITKCTLDEQIKICTKSMNLRKHI